MIYLHKILPLFTAPLFIALGLILVGVICRKRKLAFFGIVILGVFSNPFFSDWAAKTAERSYSPVDVVSLEKSAFVVVLSGDIDRFKAAVEILHAGKADKIIVTGGKTPWENKELNDGEYFLSISGQYGVDPSQVILTGPVQNTEQEARQVSRLISSDSKIILVTSALHMPRSVTLFGRYGFELTAYPIKFSNKEKFTPMKFIPSAKALHRSSQIYRELQGRLFYQLKEFMNF